MARDKIHNLVVRALKKDDWKVNHDPLYIEYDANQGAFEIDLGAEKLISAVKGNRRIAVEVKTFAGSISNQFHLALGQFIDYEAALATSLSESDRKLYLALPVEVFNKLDSIEFFRQRMLEFKLRFICIDLEIEEIVKWIH
ncbi:MAG: element excision factor XisH family protein [Bacteroidota bacterium]